MHPACSFESWAAARTGRPWLPRIASSTLVEAVQAFFKLPQDQRTDALLHPRGPERRLLATISVLVEERRGLRYVIATTAAWDSADFLHTTAVQRVAATTLCMEVQAMLRGTLARAEIVRAAEYNETAVGRMSGRAVPAAVLRHVFAFTGGNVALGVRRVSHFFRNAALEEFACSPMPACYPDGDPFELRVRTFLGLVKLAFTTLPKKLRSQDAAISIGGVLGGMDRPGCYLELAMGLHDTDRADMLPHVAAELRKSCRRREHVRDLATLIGQVYAAPDVPTSLRAFYAEVCTASMAAVQDHLSRMPTLEPEEDEALRAMRDLVIVSLGRVRNVQGLMDAIAPRLTADIAASVSTLAEGGDGRDVAASVLLLAVQRNCTSLLEVVRPLAGSPPWVDGDGKGVLHYWLRQSGSEGDTTVLQVLGSHVELHHLFPSGAASFKQLMTRAADELPRRGRWRTALGDLAQRQLLPTTGEPLYYMLKAVHRYPKHADEIRQWTSELLACGCSTVATLPSEMLPARLQLIDRPLTPASVAAYCGSEQCSFATHDAVPCPRHTRDAVTQLLVCFESDPDFVPPTDSFLMQGSSPAAEQPGDDVPDCWEDTC
eukprot:TRINITY_DN7354_c0_g1_i1.p1 TRINITY_DN7354_c0_g1~~TRINITY_DN7354_c0_g1_i1.p1  ORF type:complete len:626 (+),score=153.41 TRINITY_DN7354_c0_g1_i1:70-1878(+)